MCGNTRHAHCFSCVVDEGCGFCTNSTSGTGTCLRVPKNSSGGAFPTECVPGSTLSWNEHSCETRFAWISVVLLVFYLGCFAPGMGPMPWTINSEIYPGALRSTCAGIATSTNWLTNLIMSFTFLSLIEAVSAQGAFWFYCSIGSVGLFALYIHLPETRGWSYKTFWRNSSRCDTNKRLEQVCICLVIRRCGIVDIHIPVEYK